MTMTPQQIIDALQQTSNPIGKQLVREVVASMYRLLDMDVIVAEIRESTGLYTCQVMDLPGHIESVICNLASQNVWLMSRLPENEQLPETSLRENVDVASTANRALREIYAFNSGGESAGLPRCARNDEQAPDQLPSCQGGVAEGRGGLFWPDEQADRAARLEEWDPEGVRFEG